MRYGSHLSVEKGLISAIQYTIELGGSALQIFISPNRGTSPGKVIPKADAETVKTILKNTGVYLVIHGKYIMNFCSPNVVWYHDALVSDLRKANQLGSTIGVVIHQGKNKPDFKQSRSEAIKTYVSHLQRVLEATKDISNPIILENSCQQGNEIGYTLEELAEIYHTFEAKYQKRIKFCLDTCHIFVAGTLQFKSIEEVDGFMERFDSLIGLNKLEVIHFNDSKTPFDQHNDHHHDITHGYIASQSYESSVKKYQKSENIGRGSVEGLKRLVGWAKKFEIPLILEVPLEDTDRQEQIDLLSKWVNEAEIPKSGGKPKMKKKIMIKKK